MLSKEKEKKAAQAQLLNWRGKRGERGLQTTDLSHNKKREKTLLSRRSGSKGEKEGAGRL